MKPSTKATAAALTTSLILWLLPTSLAAQSVWIDQHLDQSFALEALKPSFSDGEDISFLTSVLYLSGRFRLSERIRVVAELPVSHFGDESEFGDEGGTSLGNPYVGVELTHPDVASFIEIGLRVPLASEEGAGLGTGFVTDFDRLEAFLPDALAVLVAPNYVYANASGFGVRVRLGPSLIVNTDEDEFSDRTEVFGLYGAQLWYGTGRVRVGAGFTGRVTFTEEGANLRERTVHHVGAALIGDLGDVRPGLHFKVPVDEDFGDFLNYVVGLSLSVPLR